MPFHEQIFACESETDARLLGMRHRHWRRIIENIRTVLQQGGTDRWIRWVRRGETARRAVRNTSLLSSSELASRHPSLLATSPPTSQYSSQLYTEAHAQLCTKSVPVPSCTPESECEFRYTRVQWNSQLLFFEETWSLVENLKHKCLPIPIEMHWDADQKANSSKLIDTQSYARLHD